MPFLSHNSLVCLKWLQAIVVSLAEVKLTFFNQRLNITMSELEMAD